MMTALIAAGGVNCVAALDLMIADIFMPRMRGFDSIRMFHERAPAAPLIAISDYAFSVPEDPACLTVALGPGATRCLRKPFRPTTLLSVIDECLSEAEPHRRHAARLAALADPFALIGRQDNRLLAEKSREDAFAA